MPSTTATTYQEMQAVLDEARPGDRLRIVFADLPIDPYRIQMILALCQRIGRTPTLDLGELAIMNLVAVAESGKWVGFRTYEATVLEGFDAEDFAYRTLRHGLLESIEKL